MQGRCVTMLGIAAVISAGMVLAPRPAAAQQQGQDYYTYVSEWAVPRAQWDAFNKEEEATIPRMKKLVADGILVDWGNIQVRVHEEDGYTHAEWFTATSRADLLKALEEQWTTATNASFVSATKHYDLFLHTFAHGGKSVPNATGYIRVGFYFAKPDASDHVRDLMKNQLKPALDSEVADGTLLMYNLDEQDIHTSAPGAYNMALVFPDGAAMDKFFADLTAKGKENPTIGELLSSLTLGKEHRDALGRVTAYEHK